MKIFCVKAKELREFTFDFVKGEFIVTCSDCGHQLKFVASSEDELLALIDKHNAENAQQATAITPDVDAEADAFVAEMKAIADKL